MGAYLQEAANQGNFEAIAWGVGALILIIVTLDQLVWRPLLAWSERFTMSMVESATPPDLLVLRCLAEFPARCIS